MHLHFLLIGLVYISSTLLSPCYSQIGENAILPIQAGTNIDADQVRLGKALYSDPLFSKTRSISCASCHAIQKGGTDNLSKYIGIHKKQGSIATPTVLNASLNFRQFWDGRAKTLEDVIEDHIKDENVFANDWPTIIQRLKQNNRYKNEFSNIFKNNITPTNVKECIAAFIKVLLTPNAPFDRYLNGEKNAISNDALKGYALFKKYGCITCHQGQNIGGNFFERFGIYRDYFAGRGNLSKVDYGRFNVTGKEGDKYVFKVPSLRNISLTAPYFHDGSAKTLQEAIQLMGVYQVGQPIPNYEVPYIIKFLETLTGNTPDIMKNEN